MNDRTFLELLAYLCNSYLGSAQSDPEQDERFVSYLKEHGSVKNVPPKAPPMASKMEKDKELLDVREAAELLGCSAKWIYENYRTPHTPIGTGPKPRLRFRRKVYLRGLSNTKSTGGQNDDGYSVCLSVSRSTYRIGSSGCESRLNSILLSP